MIVKFWLNDVAYTLEAPEGSVAFTNKEGVPDTLVIPDPATGVLDAESAIYLPGEYIIKAAQEGRHGLRLISVVK